MRINHSYAIELEVIVRKLYKCDRGGLNGLVDADVFEGDPFKAAELVGEYYRSDGKIDALNDINDLIASFQKMFDLAEGTDADTDDITHDYVEELKCLMEKYGE